MLEEQSAGKLKLQFTNKKGIALCEDMLQSFVIWLLCSHFLCFAEDKDILRKATRSVLYFYYQCRYASIFCHKQCTILDYASSLK